MGFLLTREEKAPLSLERDEFGINTDSPAVPLGSVQL